MQKQLLFLVLLFSIIQTQTQAQVGGLFTYEFLNFAASARVSALGGTHIAVADDDINLAANNPSALNAQMHQQLSFSHAFHPAGINYGYATVGFHKAKWDMTFQGGIRYVNYGEFDQTNELGEVEGTFKAGEYGLTVGAAKPIADRLTAGANIRLVTSNFESYNSLGLLADLGLFYQDTAKNFNFTIVARNAGRQLSTYREDNQEPLPFEIQLGLSKRLRHLPFRFSVIYRYLDRWNVSYDDPNSQEQTLFLGEEPTERSSTNIWMDNFFRHFVFNGELLMGKQDNFRLRFGYSHMLRKELTVEEYRSLAGFTFGVGLKINRFRIDFGRGTFHLGGGVTHLSISTNMEEFR